MKRVGWTRVLRGAGIAATTLLGASVGAAQSLVFDAGEPGSLSARIVAAEGGPG